MCCFSVADMFLEDPPPEKKEEEKKEEKVKKNYVLVSDQLNLQPIVSSTPPYSCTFTSFPSTPLRQPPFLIFLYNIRESIVAIFTSDPFRIGIRHDYAIHPQP